MKKITKLLIPAICLLMLAGTMNQLRFSHTQRSSRIDAHMGAAPATPTINLVLGGFRGVLADWLWLRAMILQEQGRFLELVQLAEWITALQPQFAEIWTMHAWNLAYNITVLLPEGQERWRWVRHGYEMLRDQAIPATQYHPRVCSELAWILMHKIAGTSDDCADTYFANWVELYTPLLTPEGNIPTNPSRKKTFIKETGLPTGTIERLESSFGPHDWRHPMTHAAAWAFAGFALQPDRDGAIMAERLFMQTYRSLFLQGGITRDPQTGDILLAPDFRRKQGLLQAFGQAYERGTHHRLNQAYLSTLERMTQELAAAGNRQEARNVYTVLLEIFPESSLARKGFLPIAAPPLTRPLRRIPMPEKTP